MLIIRNLENCGVRAGQHEPAQANLRTGWMRLRRPARLNTSPGQTAGVFLVEHEAKPVLGIEIRIRMFLGLQDPDSLVKGMDPDSSLFS